MTAAPAPITICGGFEKIEAREGFFREATLAKGRDRVQSQHVGKVREVQDAQCQRVTIQGQCIPETSIRKNEYKIELDIDPSTREVKEGKCTCVAGVSGQCKHGAALFHFVNNERTEGKTDSAQTWKEPSKRAQALYPKGGTVETLFQFPATQRPTFKKSEKEGKDLADELELFGLTDSALFKTLTAEPAEVDAAPTGQVLSVGLLSFLRRDIFTIPGVLAEKEKNPLYLQEVKCSEEERENIFRDTTMQAGCKRWFQERKCRISASKAHRISRARKEETCMRYFIGTDKDNENFKYGRHQEPLAKKKYEEVTGNSVQEAGLLVKKNQPWLCASPDGIVEKEGEVLLLEVKCPSSCRGKKISVPYVEENQLKKVHPYFSQVQLQMYCAEVEKCDFFVFSSADYVLITVHKDTNYL